MKSGKEELSNIGDQGTLGATAKRQVWSEIASGASGNLQTYWSHLRMGVT